MSGIPIASGVAANQEATVDTSGNLAVKLPLIPGQIGGVRMFSENDPGVLTGNASLVSPETSDDFRLRVEGDTVLDTEAFCYAAQNTGKHNFVNTTLAASWGSGYLTTNSTAITTINTGLQFRTYDFFPLMGASQLYGEFNAAFTSIGVTNTIIDFGFFLSGGANPFAPTDGAYFRVTNAGIIGVVNFAGVETTTGVFAFAPTLNTNAKYSLTVTQRSVDFWINDQLAGSIPTPAGNGQPFQSAALPLAVRHAIVGGAASGVIQFKVADYTVSTGGFISTPAWEQARAAAGAHGYQGQSGGTMGSTANYANSANPAAAVPTNTTAALGAGLGGQFWETDTLAVTTDGIISSYQNPAGTATYQGRTLLIYGVYVDSYIQTGLTGGGYNAQWSIAFGHTAVALNTAESATAKAPRRIALGSNTVASGAVALTQLATIGKQFQAPIAVQPGGFFAVVKKKVGTAPSAGVVAHAITVDAVFV